MSTALGLRRHLYAEAARTRGRRRRTLRKQIALLVVPESPGDPGGSGMREPRRPGPPTSPARAAAPLPGASSDPTAPARA